MTTKVNLAENKKNKLLAIIFGMPGFQKRHLD